ncbi:MAG: prepilin-type N-terminal cleavage/methylation domain-containing protein [bacterium]
MYTKSHRAGRWGAFTLIELLIVVAIIGILAAIAVPNFMNARVRAKITRAVADMRNIGTAFGAYSVDHGEYPLGIIMGHIPRERWNWGFLPESLTTPVAYLNNLPEDEFNIDYKIFGQQQGLGDQAGTPHVRYRTARKQPYTGPSPAVTPEDWEASWKVMLERAQVDGEYILTSPGPDHTEDILPAYNPHPFSASNGLASSGDLVYCDGGVAGI